MTMKLDFPTMIETRKLIAVTGEEAEHFLQNIITTDIESLTPQTIRPGALLSPQGKVMFDFLIMRLDHSFIIDIHPDIADSFAKRLTLYKLRAAVDVAAPEAKAVIIDCDRDHGVQDMRFKQQAIYRHYPDIAPDIPHNSDQWRLLRIDNGVAQGGDDYAWGDVFAHDVNLDQIGGMSFHKGCYIGQEVVSRMHHRGTARKRVIIASAQQNLPITGTALESSGKIIGALGSVEGNKALAIVRLDKVVQANNAQEPIMAQDCVVHCILPPHVTFGFPDLEDNDRGEA